MAVSLIKRTTVLAAASLTPFVTGGVHYGGKAKEHDRPIELSL
jgi:hypothetical protein